MTETGSLPSRLLPLQESDVPGQLDGWTVLEMDICPFNDCLVLQRVKLVRAYKTKALATRGLIQMEARTLAVGIQDEVEGIHEVGSLSPIRRTSLDRLGILAKKSGLARSFADTPENERALSALVREERYDDYFKIVGFTAKGVNAFFEHNAKLFFAAILEEKLENVPGILKS